MIKGNIKTIAIDIYKDSYPMLYEALKYLKNNIISEFENGTKEIIKDKMKIIVSEYNTKPFNENAWESHRAYVDVQFIAHGCEKMHYTSVDNLSVVKEYNQDKDITFYNAQNPYDYCVLTDGDFIVFEQHDAHMPCIIASKTEYIKKAIIKFKP